MASSELAFSSAESLSAGPVAEPALVERCRRGDPQAFARLVSLHERMVLNLAARLFLVDAITSIQDGKRLRLDLNYKF